MQGEAPSGRPASLLEAVRRLIYRIRGQGLAYLLFSGSQTSICLVTAALLKAAFGATATLGATTALAWTDAWAAFAALAQATGVAAREEHTACILKWSKAAARMN